MTGDPLNHPLDTTVAVLQRAAQAAPDRVFLDFGGETMTYGVFERESNRLAHALRDLGLAAGEPLALMLDNTIEAVLFWFAANKLGAISAPVNTAFKGRFLANQIADCGAGIAVIEDDYAERLDNIRGDMPALRHVIRRSEAAGLAAGQYDPIRCEVRPSDPALIIYTSGTTGPSKGCVIPHNQVAHLGYFNVAAKGTGSDDVLWTCLPLFHLNAIGVTVMGAAVAQARAAIVPRFSVSNFWADVRRSGATEVALLGSMAQMIGDAPDSPDAAAHFCKIKRLAAAPLSLATAQTWEARFGVPARPSSGYGMTEVSCVSTTGPDDPPGPDGSSGRAGRYFDILIADEDERPVPVGQPGEILCRPRYPHIMFSGYWNKPEATVQAWRNLWFHTGDLGKLDEAGYLYFVDRKKDYIRRRGENISSLELEAVLRAHPAIQDVAVHAVLSPHGEDEVKVTAELKPGEVLAEAALCEWCVPRLPYFAVPLYIEFRDELPRTPTGKVQKDLLRQDGPTVRTWSREDAGFVLEKR